MRTVNEVARLSVENGIATVTIDSPPVNALSAAVRSGLAEGVRQALLAPDVQGVVLICAGRTFFAGADISELDKRPEGPEVHAIQAIIEGASKPVVAAIHGTALGGGFEVALACHYRVAAPSAKVGLPEVSLGLLPAAGGTQRLPRIVGPAAALEIMAFGRPIAAPRALDLELIDALADEGSLHSGAVDFLGRAIREKRPLRRVRDRDDRLGEAKDDPGLFDTFRQANARAFRGFRAPENIIRAVEAAVALPFDQGIRREGELFGELLASTESAAQRYAFFAERQAAKIPDIPAQTASLPIRSVGVVGAGATGVGIAMTFLNIGVPVTMVEQTQEALDRSLSAIRRNYEAAARAGRPSRQALEQRMALLSPTLDLTALGEADLVVEAVFENFDLKRQVFAQLDAVTAPHAILASNTSFLDLDALAAATSRPQQVLGMHFFLPADATPLLEVVRGKATSKEVIDTAMQLGRKIGKTPVLSRAGHGFIANRMMSRRQEMAYDLVLHGPTPWDIDRVMVEFGFPMGPFAMADLIGLDIVGWNPATSSSSTLLEALGEQGRWGSKRHGGFYDYGEDLSGTPSPVVGEIIARVSHARGGQRRSYADRDLLEHLLYPVVNEGARLLEESLAVRASDIDIALVKGYGWPVFTGGPLFWADTVGLERIVTGLEMLSAGHGERYAPTKLLCDLAASGQKLHRIGS